MTKKLISLTILLLLLAGCATGIKPVCRHKAMMAALIYSETHKVRLMYGPMNDGSDIKHIQGQAQDEETKEWFWIDFVDGEAKPAKKHWWYSPKIIFTFKEVLKIWFLKKEKDNENM